MTAFSLDILWKLLTFDGPSGDEGALADWLSEHLTQTIPDVRLERLGNSLLALRGKPTVAVFAHTDTTGFTLGFDRELIPIGGPSPKRGEALREIGQAARGQALRVRKNGAWTLSGPKTDTLPGSRWVYAARPERDGDELVAPYLDNRVGVWAALHVLGQYADVAVAFTVGEEHSGQGALVCGRRLFETHGISRALISDLTWDTAHVHCGAGVAVSLRDEFVPRQRFLAQVLALAERSGLPFQREIERSGSSDGGFLERSGLPWDWVFVGAPQKHPHTSRERVVVSDLYAMAALLCFLTNSLHHDT